MHGDGVEVGPAEQGRRQSAAPLVEGDLAGDGALRRIEINVDRKLAFGAIGPRHGEAKLACAPVARDQPFTGDAPHRVHAAERSGEVKPVDGQSAQIDADGKLEGTAFLGWRGRGGFGRLRGTQKVDLARAHRIDAERAAEQGSE